MTFRQEQIEENLNSLDFDMIRKVMEFLDWRWIDTKTNLRRIPEKEELRKMANICMNRALDANGVYSSGGFEAEAIDGIVEIRFILDRANILSKKM